MPLKRHTTTTMSYLRPAVRLEDGEVVAALVLPAPQRDAGAGALVGALAAHTRQHQHLALVRVPARTHVHVHALRAVQQQHRGGHGARVGGKGQCAQVARQSSQPHPQAARAPACALV